MATKNETQTLENAIQQLEKIVLELETGELPLEDALKKFEDGVELTKFCSQTLNEIEKKISLLTQDKNGGIIEKPLTSEDPDSDN